MITNTLAIISLVLAIILLVPMVCRKLHIPSIVGFILTGIILSPYSLNILAPSVTIATLGKMGMLYIMLQAGIEIDINDFSQHRRGAVALGFYSFLFPRWNGRSDEERGAEKSSAARQRQRLKEKSKRRFSAPDF